MKLKPDKKTLNNLPSLVASDAGGNLFDIPEYGMLGRSGGEFVIPEEGSLIELPYGSDLHVLPGRYPVGIDRRSGKVVTLREYGGMKLFAASAFLAPAYTALYLSTYEKEEEAGPLPLFAYSAIGFRGESFVVPALRVDRDRRQDCENFDQDEVVRRGKGLLKRFSGNRLTTHLIEKCAFEYLCPAARNWVMGRWEAPIPVSSGCNSQCTGCISKQEDETGVPSTQDRMLFTPTVEEIVQYAVPHLDKAPRSVVSFGQGCEGEPLTQAALIEASVKEMRQRTKRGTINLNTNASLPASVEKICKAGLDSMRVSMNSIQKDCYDSYFSPQGYSFEDVIESVRVAKDLGVWVSLNYFIYPGLTDSEDELEAMLRLLKEMPIDMIQMRNLNMDPELYPDLLGKEAFRGKNIGILNWMKEVKKVRPGLRFGYFNPPLSERLKK